MGISVQVSGFDALAELTRDLRQKGARKKDVNKIFKQRAKPTKIAIIGNIDNADRTVIRRSKDGTIAGIYEPGNLKKSIQIFVGRKGSSKENPTVYIGPNVKDTRKFDGYYAWFIINGTKFQAPNDFIGEAGDPLQKATESAIVKDLIKLLNKQIK